MTWENYAHCKRVHGPSGSYRRFHVDVTEITGKNDSLEVNHVCGLTFA